MTTEVASTVVEEEDYGDCQGQAKLIKTLEVRTFLTWQSVLCFPFERERKCQTLFFF